MTDERTPPAVKGLGTGASTHHEGERVSAHRGDERGLGRGLGGRAPAIAGRVRRPRVFFALLRLAVLVLAVATLSPSGRLGELTRAEALRKEGKLDEAEAIAAPHVEHPGPKVRALALGIVARVRLKQGRTDEALAGLTTAAAVHREAGQPAESLRDELALVHVCIYQGRRFADARAALARAEELAQTPADRPQVLYFQGLLAFETGDLRAALWFFRETLSESERLGMSVYLASALPQLAFVLQILGREGEGEALLHEAERAAATADECLQADVWGNIAWFRLRSDRDLRSAEELLKRALALRRSRCPDASAQARALTDYAVLCLRQGREGDARERLAEARAALDAPDGALVSAWLDVEGRLAQRAGRHLEALAIFERLASVAEAGLLPRAAWSAALGRARALDALGRTHEAGEAFEHAEALVAQSSLLVPADEGRVGYLDGFDEGTRAAVEFFLPRDPARAATIARRARARARASLRWVDRVAALTGEERARWEAAMAAYRRGRADLDAMGGDYWKLTAPELAAAVAKQRDAQARLTRQLDEAIASLHGGNVPGAVELATPSRNELFLVYHPLDRRIAAFAITAEGTAAEVISTFDPGGSPEALSATLLAPFRAAIGRAALVRFITSGPLELVDLHTLPWDGAPLIATVPVVYGADTGPSPARPFAARALVVADPRGDLPATRAEGVRVSGALLAADLEVASLLGEKATYSAVRDAIEAAPLALFHYAGHGTYGGTEGWDSRLRLAEGSALSVGDILSLRAAPAHVVLSGCETARSASGAAAGGLGLAHAFLVAGARAVIAAPRPVDDALAGRIAAALYDPPAPPAALGEALAERLRAAELGARADAPGVDWGAFRLLVP